jgi:hypothetical protein
MQRREKLPRRSPSFPRLCQEFPNAIHNTPRFQGRGRAGRRAGARQRSRPRSRAMTRPHAGLQRSWLTSSTSRNGIGRRAFRPLGILWNLPTKRGATCLTPITLAGSWSVAERKPPSLSILPMQLQVGDRYTDEAGEWEVVARPVSLSRRNIGTCSRAGPKSA